MLKAGTNKVGKHQIYIGSFFYDEPYELHFDHLRNMFLRCI